MHSNTLDTTSLHKKAYLLLLKQALYNHTRSVYDYSPGGSEAVELYKVSCHLIKKADSLGALLRIARDLHLNVPEMVQLILSPLVEGIEPADLKEIPGEW